MVLEKPLAASRPHSVSAATPNAVLIVVDTPDRLRWLAGSIGFLLWLAACPPFASTCTITEKIKLRRKLERGPLTANRWEIELWSM